MNSLSSGQIGLPLEFLREPDRNFAKGGRSFYFFDFDDNVAHLPTRIVLFHKNGGPEVALSTSDFAWAAKRVGVRGTEFQDYELREDPISGSYRNFREQPQLSLANQPLMCDMEEALQHPFLDWRGPSWDFFVYAVNNNRPISVITARGHHPHTIRRAINRLVLSRDLSGNPNFLSVYPVTHSETRRKLGDIDSTWSTAALKKEAIKAAVRDAFECYGENPNHRFGMSDDDPLNVALIREAMQDLKKLFPENAFFVINTHNRQLAKEEILLVPEPAPVEESANQMSLLSL